MCKKNAPQAEIPDSVKESLTTIIDYLWEDELRHLRDITVNQLEIRLGEHIFAHLMKVRAWLESGTRD